MDTQTQAGLDKSKAFLNDGLELAHRALQRLLQDARDGKEVDWRAIDGLLKEGRATVKQITQVASTELRDRALKLREDKASEKKQVKQPPKPKPTKAPQPQDREKFVELSTQWLGDIGQAAHDPAKLMQLDYPPELKAMFREYGLDPSDGNPLETLGEWLMPEAA